MHFCNICGNMYYMSLDKEDSNKLVYLCRNCGNIDDTILNSQVISISSNNVSNGMDVSQFVNKYTKFDPTLPRLDNSCGILCPNIECKSNTEEKDKEILYIKYDAKNLKYLFVCCVCDTIWKSNDNN